MVFHRVIVIFLFVSSLFFVENVYAKTFVVNTEVDDMYDCVEKCSLRSALEFSQKNDESDDIIFTHAVTHIQLKDTLSIQAGNKKTQRYDVRLRGPVHIDGMNKHRVFFIEKNATVMFDGIDMSNGFVSLSHGGGAGVYNEGNLVLNNVDIFANRIVGNNAVSEQLYGAGIYNAFGAQLIIRHSTIGPRNNIDGHARISHVYGAGIYSRGLLDIDDSNIEHNVIQNSSSGKNAYIELHGAGIYLAEHSSAYIDDSAIVYNRLRGETYNNKAHLYARGAGMVLGPYATLHVNNSTISSNKSQAYAYSNNFAYAHGGGVFAHIGSHLFASNVTLAYNIVDTPLSIFPDATAVANGLYVLQNNMSDIRFKNSIFYHKTNNCNEHIVSDDYNISNDESCDFDKIHDIQNADTILKSLQKYDAFTYTHALDFTSPAIDSANPEGCFDYYNNVLLHDQRGKVRPQYSCDRGAHEFE